MNLVEQRTKQHKDYSGLVEQLRKLGEVSCAEGDLHRVIVSGENVDASAVYQIVTSRGYAISASRIHTGKNI